MSKRRPKWLAKTLRELDDEAVREGSAAPKPGQRMTHRARKIRRPPSDGIAPEDKETEWRSGPLE